jgi:hypothetical protein
VFLILCTRFTPLIITQHTDCLLTLTDAHCKTIDIQVFCFHATTTQNSHCASPASPHSHKCQPRKFFHYKLYTLPESTSMIPIKCSQNTRFLVLFSLSLSHSSIVAQLVAKRSGKNSSIQPSSPTTNRTTPHYLLPKSFTFASLLFFPLLPKILL